jgi:Flp pilus assembly secretin CpaC
LSGTARTTWTEALRAELGDQLAATVEVTVTPSGRVVLTTPCSSDGVSDEGPAAEAARRLGLATEDGAGDGGPVVVACRGRRERYRLSVRIQAVSESTAKTLGFDGGAALSGAWARSRSFAVGARGEGAASSLDARLWTELQNLSQSHDADILGTPVLRLTAGAPGELSTGGEFPVAVLAGGASGSSASADVYQREWKSYGLTLKATAGPGAVTAHAGPLVRLALDVTLKTRAGARSGTLSVTTLKSTVEAAPSAPTMIGIVELASDEREETERQGLASVPIIGPLFRRAASGHAKEHAVVWATVEVDREDEAQGDLFVPPKPSRDAPEASKSGAEPSSMETAPKTGYPDGTTPQGSPR